MLSKTFSLLLSVFSVAMIVVVFLAYRELQSNGFSPAVIAANFNSSANQAWLFLWISSLILLVIANVMYIKTLASWGLFATLGYFVTFVLLLLWWLNQLLYDYQQANNLPAEQSFLFSTLSGPILAILAAVLVYANRFALQKMLAPPAPATLPEKEERPVETVE